MRLDWLKRMMDALDLMEGSMEERLDIEEIAKAAYVSPFHFQRMFFMLTGMTIAEYMRKRRLTLAAQEIASSSVKVIDAALKYGYDSPESFAKAFRKIHGVSPSEARQPGVSLKAYPRISFHLSLKGDKDMDYRIVEKEGFEVVGKSIRLKDGEQPRIAELWAASNQDGTAARLSAFGDGDLLYGVCLDMQPGEGDFTYMVAGRIDASREHVAADAADGLERASIPAATWAIFPSVGPLPGAIQSVFSRIYQEWFPATGYEHAGGPEMEVYPSGDTTAEHYRCEIWVPVVKK
ncbi:AraC family transcriptional regulator [Cohnella nanjingensis]|uniref:GyrI-like domain-containing protein n=1 Tax=Cohnella nanjingensis TaxID=1387779 RepID=A0A7X0RTE2_9BACL|nr:GyrI-like domain-containing protein [Cohnella nanjingensis]MBB6672060.1 GyrI-like domain-containing protein [Cohnella nanjingensis]